MTTLAMPDLTLAASLPEVVDEFRAAGEQHIHGSGLWDFDPLDLGAAGRRAVVDHLVAQADPATPLPADRVHCTYFWLTDAAGELVGFLALRHSLTPFLLGEGGHIGYGVRPSRRREGHATRALVLAVRRAADLGLDRVLVTCDEDNDASRRTIERCGGVLEDVRNGKRRYWIDTQ